MGRSCPVDSVSREQSEGGDTENCRTRFSSLEVDTGEPLPAVVP